MLYRGQPGPGYGAHDLARRLIGVARLVDRDVAVQVDDDPGGPVVPIDVHLLERLPGGAARHAPPGSVIHGIAADRGGGSGPQDEARVVVRTRERAGVPGMLPDGARQR